MTTTADAIKEHIYDKIAEINDENILIAIQTIIENIEINSLDSVTEKEDFAGYIKEWVKNM